MRPGIPDVNRPGLVIHVTARVTVTRAARPSASISKPRSYYTLLFQVK